MESVLYKQPIIISVKTLKTLIENFKEYSKTQKYSEDETVQYDEAQTAIDLITGGISQLRSASNELKSLVKQLRDDFIAMTSKEEKKSLLQLIESLEKDTNFNEAIGNANELIYMLEARVTEAKSTRQKLSRKHGFIVKPDISEQNDARKHEKLREKQSGEGNNDRESEITENSEWLTEDYQTNGTEDLSIASQASCRAVKPPTLTLPKFYGTEEDFPEFWAIYETLVHKNVSLTVVEKMLLLKDSLKGRSDSAIKGIQLVPQNYDWMINALKKKYGNKPTNRARIVQRLSLMRPANNTAENCSYVHDKITMLINQMVSAGQDIRRTKDAMWTETILQKFPHDIVKSVLIAIKEKDEVFVEDVMEQIENEISAKCYVDARMKNYRAKSPIQGHYEAKSKPFIKPGSECVFCERSGHISAQCRTVSDVEARRKVLQDKKLCWKCFTNSHSSNQCTKADCPLCNRKHHSSVCFATSKTNYRENTANRGISTHDQRNSQRYGKRSTENNPRAGQPIRNHIMNDVRQQQIPPRMPPTNYSNLEIEAPQNNNSQREQVILMTAEGSIWNNNSGHFEKILFFFDTGAQKTIIQEELATKLGLPKLKTETCVMSGIGGHTEMFQSNIVSLKIGTAYGKDLEILVQTKPVITNGFPSVKLTAADRQFLQNSEICISNSNLRGEHQTPHILVGLDYYHNFIFESSESPRTPSGLRVAKTVFGPTLYGRGTLETENAAPSLTYGMTAVVETSESDMLQKIFELEGLGISSSENEKKDETLEYFKVYSKQISFENGYVTAPFPLKSNVSDLADNYAIAIKRLQALHRQLSTNPEQQHWYSKIFNEYLENDIVERVNGGVANSVGTYYMPHSGVWRAHKAKPLRIVFDASSKKRGESSLNDVIFKGESQINKIHDILISSRMSKIILICDIEAAFTQIRLQNSHKDLCRFLWFKNPHLPPTRDNIVEYRFNRLPFGITASPSILNVALLTFLEKKNSPLSREIARNLYVDNILLEAQNVQEAKEKYEHSKAIFAEIGMNIREYVSNSEMVNSIIPEKDRAPDGQIKLLGVIYDTKTDHFLLNLKFPCKNYLTKKDVVSQLNSIYDPIGIAGPLLIRLKVLMREIFDAGTDWDKILPAALTRKWNTACQELNNTLLSIPRWISPGETPATNQMQIWVFADASMTAIACCAFLQNSETRKISSLISGKTRLAPKKAKQTIPRLELLGILIALRLGTTIFEATGKKIPKVNIVTDSEIALCWTKSTRKLPIFVENQRNRINTLKNSLNREGASVVFYHVATEFNPADAGTRGILPKSINNIDWMRGALWLQEMERPAHLRELSEIHEKYEIQSEEDSEPTAKAINPMINQVNETEPTFIDLSRFSKMTTTLRTIARIGKKLHSWINAVNVHRTKPITLEQIQKFSTDLHITSEDMQLSETILLQQEHKNISLNDLQKRFPHKRIFRDENGIIRNQSRLQNANLALDTKSPIFIDNNSDLARLILVQIHRKNAHCGKDQTLCIARQRFWIQRPSAAYNKFLKNCVICKRSHGLPLGAPLMPPLPADRVVRTKAFENVGCDFMGPILSNNNERMYVCLYTCLTTRAVHLEVVENMSTGAFLSCLIRFVSRRGVPKLIRTDCGTNFKLGKQIIDLMFENEDVTGSSVMSYSADAGIKWVFNPPGAPWMGGAWERLVGTVKRALQKSIGRRKLSFNQFHTTITRIEAIVNTRPLTKMSSSDISEIPLRPIDFLQGNLKFALPEQNSSSELQDRSYDPELIQTVMQAKQALEHSEQIANKFWERWNTEYLTALREIQRIDLNQPRHAPLRPPQIGEIVLIEQEFIPRGNWSYGKIIDLIKSKDGEIRSVKILMPNKHIWHRPLNKIYPLEIRSIPESSATVTETVNVERENQNGNTRPMRQARIRATGIIQEFERSLEEPISRGSSPSRGSVSNMSLILVLFVTLWCNTNAQLAEISCMKRDIWVSVPKTKFEICFDDTCRKFPQMAKNLSLQLPIFHAKESVSVSLRYALDGSPHIVTEECKTPHICEDPQAILSKKLIGNPHCWPMGAMISLAVILYIIGAISMSLILCIKRNRKAKETHKRTQSRSESIQLTTFTPAPLITRNIPVITCLIMIACVNMSTTCQHGHTRHSVNLICENKEKCYYEYNREILFNKAQVNLCTSIVHGNNTVGIIEIRNSPMIMKCAKRTLFFTRNTRNTVYSIIRCAEAGSCTGNVCSTLSPNSTVEELSMANSYPGYVGCDHSCGGIACGCLLPLPACSFYKVTHIPLTDKVYEVIDCSEWNPTIRLEIRITLYNKKFKKNIVLVPYITQKVDDYEITAISVQKPQIAIMNRRFAISRYEALAIPEDYRLPVECSSAIMASTEFNKCINRIICSCNAQNPLTRCQCPKEAISDIKNDSSNLLPIQTPFSMTYVYDNELLTNSVEGEIVISINSKSLINSADYILEQDCSISMDNLTGCYNCMEGAQVLVKCQTSYPAWIAIQCEDNVFSVQCGPHGKNTTLSLEFNRAIVNLKCHAECNRETVEINLSGTLHFTTRMGQVQITETSLSTWSKHFDWFEEFSLPDLHPLINIIKNHWKLATAIFGTTILLTVSTYFFGPVAILIVCKILVICTQCIVKTAGTLLTVIVRLCRHEI